MGGRGGSSGRGETYSNVNLIDIVDWDMPVDEYRKIAGNKIIFEKTNIKATEENTRQGQYVSPDGYIIAPGDLGRRNPDAYIAASSGAYKDINGHFRTGEPPKLKPGRQRSADALDNSMKAVGKNMMAYRNVDTDFLKTMGYDGTPGSLLGVKITDKGYTSVSTNFNQNAFLDMPVQMRMKVPKTTKGVASRNFGESEVVLHRGLSYQITGARNQMVDFGGGVKEQRLVLDVQVLN